MFTRRALIATGATAVVARPARAGAGYDAALAAAWGGRLDPAEGLERAWTAIHDLHRRADRLLRRQGLDQGSVAERLRRLAEDPRHLFPDSDAGRDAAVAAMNASLAKLRPRLGPAFGNLVLPPAAVQRMSRTDEATARGGYRGPDAYFVDLARILQRPAWTLASVAYHETVPGHALQAALETRPVPPDRAAFGPVFAEAWATYAEQLAGDLGVYADDPLGEIGALHWRLFRMARVVADIGLGARGWSADRAAAEMTAIQGRDIAFVTIPADVARMIRQPGVYAAHGLGALEIARLRPARRADWPAFHRAIVADGPWPCAMLADLTRKTFPPRTR